MNVNCEDIYRSFSSTTLHSAHVYTRPDVSIFLFSVSWLPNYSKSFAKTTFGSFFPFRNGLLYQSTYILLQTLSLSCSCPGSLLITILSLVINIRSTQATILLSYFHCHRGSLPNLVKDYIIKNKCIPNCIVRWAFQLILL
jgi:hypothetical protein